MKEIVQTILNQEEQAKHDINKARENAEKIVLEAKLKKNKIIEDLVKQTKDLVKKTRQEEEAKLLAAKKEELDKLKTVVDNESKQREKDITNLANKLFEEIIFSR